MNKKISGIIVVVLLLIVIGIIFSNNYLVDTEMLSENFVIDAVYFENEGYVEITFEDKSKKSNIIILEILGLPESFQKTFTDNSFIEKVTISQSQYGWKTSPVTFVIDHEDFGKIGIKTEIRNFDQIAPKIIFSRLWSVL